MGFRWLVSAEEQHIPGPRSFQGLMISAEASDGTGLRGLLYRLASQVPDHLFTVLYKMLSLLFLPELPVFSQSSPLSLLCLLTE